MSGFWTLATKGNTAFPSLPRRIERKVEDAMDEWVIRRSSSLSRWQRLTKPGLADAHRVSMWLDCFAHASIAFDEARVDGLAKAPTTTEAAANPRAPETKLAVPKPLAQSN